MGPASRSDVDARARDRVVLSRDVSVLRDADVLVVPGQGSFAAFIQSIDASLAAAMRDHIERGKPYLGICLGMQALFASSEEAPEARGLGVLAGHVRRLSPGVDPATGRAYTLPHIGWNAVTSRDSHARGSGGPKYMYFAHSYAVSPDDPAVVAATTTYGQATFASVVHQGCVTGVQFHPEKSQHEGLELLADFFRRVRSSKG